MEQSVVGSVDPTAGLFFIIEEMPYCFPYGYSGLHTQQQYGRVPFPHFYTSIFPLGYRQTNWISPGGFALHFPVIYKIDHFHIPVGNGYAFLKRFFFK